MNPVIFDFGPLSLHWYGLLIVGGAVLAAWLSNRYAVREEQDPDHIWNLLALSLILGIIGARLYHVISVPVDGLGWPYYRENPDQILNFWTGGFRGLGIYGGLAGGLIAIFGYTLLRGLNPIQYLDYIAPNVLLAQAIGRFGNYVNQELYGPPTNLPWAFTINPAYPCQLPPNLESGIQFCGTSFLTEETIAWYANHGFHPTFFYEAIWNLMMFGLLTLLIRRAGSRLRRGDIALLYFITYAIGRLWTEALRPDAWMLGPLAAAQWVAIGTLVIAGVLLVYRHASWRGQGDPAESLVRLES